MLENPIEFVFGERYHNSNKGTFNSLYRKEPETFRKTLLDFSTPTMKIQIKTRDYINALGEEEITKTKS